jgi:peptidoglycan/LPS O-acetylase OafA/YrhL
VPAPTPAPLAPATWDGARLAAVDPIRGVVCLVIVFVHLYSVTLHDRLAQLVGPVVDYVVTYLRPGFESFFVVAGFFLAHSFRRSESHYLSVSRFLGRRLLRLALPYWAALALATLDRLLPNLLLGHHNSVPGWGELAAQALFIQDLCGVPNASPVFWSMATLVQYFVIWVAAFWLVRWFARQTRLAAYQEWTERVVRELTVLAFLGSLAVVLAGVHTEWGLPRNALYLALGSVVYWSARGRVGRWMPAAMLATTLAAAAWGGHIRLVFAALTAVLLYASVTHPAASLASRPLRWLGFLGERSYSLYLTHAIVGYRVLNLSNHIEPLTTPVVLALTAAALAACLAFACLFYRYVERPVLDWSRRIGYRR